MKRRAFTLVELLVVIAIIGLLSSVAVVSLSGARVNSRNAKRKADMVQVSKALELYYSDNNTYPTTGGAWWGVTASYGSHDTSGSNGWVPNLAPTYIGILPIDPNSGKANPSSAYAPCQTLPAANTYAYRSNGTDYKFTENCTPEGTLSGSDPFVDPPRSYNWAVYTPGASAW